MKLSDLRVYIISSEIRDLVWNIVQKWDYYKDMIGKQFVKAADSISANISEGFGRFHYKENKNFLHYSRGASYETLDWLSNAKRRKMIPDDDANDLHNKIENVHIKLNANNKSIGKQ